MAKVKTTGCRTKNLGNGYMVQNASDYGGCVIRKVKGERNWRILCDSVHPKDLHDDWINASLPTAKIASCRWLNKYVK
jgi:hypothetical protein